MEIAPGFSICLPRTGELYVTKMQVTTEDIDRIEEKLDKIIRFFQIEQAPRRSKVEIRQEVGSKILQLNERKERRKTNGRKTS